jgi:hypothetical protein
VEINIRPFNLLKIIDIESQVFAFGLLVAILAYDGLDEVILDT